MEAPKKFKCPECKCLLALVYPHSDNNIACDCECYFSSSEAGEKELQWYIDKYPEQWKQLNEPNS
jgi:hypothetical protein